MCATASWRAGGPNRHEPIATADAWRLWLRGLGPVARRLLPSLGELETVAARAGG